MSKENFSTTGLSKESASTSKIHPLGSRSRNMMKETMQSSSSDFKNTGRSFCRSVKVGLPVSFGIDPQQATFLLNELQEMKKKYIELERQVT